LRAVEGELASRAMEDAGTPGDRVRLSERDSRACSSSQFALTEDDLYKVSGPVNLNRLMAVYDLIDRPELNNAASRRASSNG